MTSNAALLSRLASSSSPSPSLPSAGSWSHLSGPSAAGDTVGGASHHSQGKSMRVFATDESACQMKCRHEVGKDKRRVCVEDSLEDAETCGTRHQGNEVFLEPESFYLMPSKNVIILEPHFSFQYIGQLFQGTIRANSYTVQEFSELGFFIKSLGDNGGNLITERDVERKRLELKQPLKTPATIKRRVVMGGDGASRELFGDSPQPPSIDVEALREVSEENEWVDSGVPSSFVKHVGDIRNATLETVDSIPGVFRDLSSMHGLLAHDVELLDSRFNLMQEHISIDKAAAAESPSESLDEITSRVSNIESSVNEVEDVGKKHKKLESEFEKQEKRIKELEAQLNAVLLTVIELKEGPASSQPPRVDFKSSTKTDADYQLETLQKQVDLLIDNVGSSPNTLTAFKEFITGIKSVEDVRAWLLRHYHDGSEEPDDEDGEGMYGGTSQRSKDTSYMSFGAFTDFTVVLAIAEDLDNQTTKGETLKEMEAYEKAGLTHPGEATVAYALRQSAPPIFTKSSGAVSNKTYLKALKKAEDWDKMAGGHVFPGLKQKIESNMESIRSEVKSAIEESLSGRVRVTSLAMEMLSRSLEFLKLVSSWMSETYVELVDLSKFPKDEAWLLVTQIVARILRDLNAAKGGIRTIHPTSSPLINTSKALYAMLCVHEVMAEYRSMDIKNHPAVSSEYVKFLATHVGFNEAKGVQDSIKTLTSRMTTMENSLKTVSNKATEAQNTANFCKTKGGWEAGGIILCEGWPSWLFVLPGLGFSEIYVAFLKPPTKIIREALHELYIFKEIKLSEEEVEGVTEMESMFFVCGGREFVESVVGRFGEDRAMWLAVSGGDRYHPRVGKNFKWNSVKHSSSGGGTDCKSWIGQNLFAWKSHPPKLDSNRRALVDVLSTTENGRTSLAPAQCKRGDFLFPDEILPMSVKNPIVLAPSVFAPTKWVTRSVTNKELAMLLDVPVKLQSLDWGQGGQPFLQAVPSKSLWSATVGLRTSQVGVQNEIPTEEDQAKEDSFAPPLDIESRNAVDWSQTIASKADDAETDTLMWDLRATSKLKLNSKRKFEIAVEALNRLRGRCHRWWYQKVRKEILDYLRKKFGTDWWKLIGKNSTNKLWKREVQVLSDCLMRSVNSDWWDWSSGSTLFYWRWTKEFQESARDGITIFRIDTGPRWIHPQRKEVDPIKTAQVQKKLQKVLDRGYVESGKVLSLTNYFWVDKAKGTDIRMVYDGTKSGLNDSIWSPNFFVPSIDSLVDLVDSKTWLSDIDLGEMFLNFPLDADIQCLAGIDLTPYFPLASGKANWKRWTRCLMGVKSSPYNAVGSLRWAEEMVRGNPSDEDNPFRWTKVELNLPGSTSYNPSRPGVSKLRKDGCIANDFVDYIDDIRPTGNGHLPLKAQEEAYTTTRRIASVFNYLGIQDAPRKRRPPSQVPGAWNGCLIETGPTGVYLKVSKERWDKTASIVRRIQDELGSNPYLNFKLLRSDRGFLVYVARTYNFMVPYLKGIHLSLESWRSRRDREGWGIPGDNPNECDESFMFDDRVVSLDDDAEPGAPETIKPVPRLHDDLAALADLLAGNTPSRVRVRPGQVIWIVYGGADASGTGLGSAFRYDNGMSARMGLWGADMDDSSSNFRELYNLVDSTEQECISGRLTDAEMYLFTDNSTAESAFYRGSSSNKKLFNLVLRLRKLEMKFGLKIFLIHIPGTRMIDLGVDGLSRGNTFEGVMNDPSSFLRHIPLDKGIDVRSPELVDWFKSVFGNETQGFVESLSPEGWFERGHDVVGWHRKEEPPQGNETKPRILSPWMPIIQSGTFLWSPPPAAARQALEQLRKARHRRQDSTHIIAIPRLFTARWRRQLHKVADLVFEIRAGDLPSWDRGNAKARQDFWRLEGNCTHCGNRIRVTQGIFCANFGMSRAGLPPCREAWCGGCYKPHRLDCFHVEEPKDKDGFVWIKRGDENRFKLARNGDSLLTNFEGDRCVFLTLTGRQLPDKDRLSFSDDMLMCCIRRMNLDAFWSRERATVNATRRGVETCLEHSDSLGIKNLFPPFGPLPVKDVKGYGVAACMLLDSLKPGKYHSSHQQFDTVRKLRSSFRNVWGAALEETVTEYYLGYEDKKRQTISSCPTLSDWFGRFVMGCKKRMGQDVRPQLAISIEVMMALVELLEKRWISCRNELEKGLLATVGAYAVLCFCCSLRGNEGFQLDLAGLRSHIDKGRLARHPHVTAPLLGRFKGEEGEKYHLLFMASDTASGIPCRRWMERLVDQRAREGHFRGPAFCDDKGLLIGSGVVETFILNLLEEIQSGHPDVIHKDIEVYEVYGISRSFRRGATTHARNQGVSETDIDLTNRWRKFEEAKGKRPNMAMRDHYSQKVQMITALLRFSKAL